MLRDTLPLEGGRREVAQGRVPAMGVVEALDVVEDGRSRLGACPEDVPLEQLTLQGGEPRFGDGVVKAIAATAERRHNACLLTPRPKGNARILAAVVRMVNHAGGGTPIPERHVQGREHELGPKMIRHGPADDLPTEDV